MKQIRKTNLAVFIPHYGCKNECSFCDQRTISGHKTGITPENLAQTIERQLPFLEKGGFQTEISFFGGTFTAIGRDYMESLLQTAAGYISRYPELFSGIRCSTRPDCVDDEILGLLKSYGMSAIELGAQSMDDEVLKLNRRGHTANDVKNAAQLIKTYGFRLGLQMMTGLYGDTPDACRKTVQEFISLSADDVRIYPTVIMPNTYLGELCNDGKYTTFSFEETVALCAEIYGDFLAHGVNVLRVGLDTSAELEKAAIGGNYHPSFGEIVIGRYWGEKILCQMQKLGGEKFLIKTDKSYMSRINGYKSENRKRLAELGLSYKLCEVENLPPVVERIM